MKTGFYPGFALSGIRKNRRLYVPYMLTSIGTVMIFYILSSLSRFMTESAAFGTLTTGSLLQFGAGVIGVFSLIFLFYTNSFLIRRRKKEFGLYNVLGMGKGNIAKILLWETLILFCASLVIGLALGAVLGKLFELGLIRIINMKAVDYALHVDFRAMAETAGVYAVIFLLIFLNSLRQIHFGSPVALLRGENMGEKPPKANWFPALLGAVLLAVAYALAVTIQDPLEAMGWFCVAVILVIIATFLLFTAGSVALCRLLQRCKRYYYQARHFVSVSSMVYRMKRNGAGLASICILATMVLVTVSTTTCLYFGTEQQLEERYPREMNVSLRNYEPGTLAETEDQENLLRSKITEILSGLGYAPENVMEYRSTLATGIFQDGAFCMDGAELLANASLTANLCLIPLDSYNAICNAHETLEPGQALIINYRMDYSGTELTAAGRTYSLRRLPDGQLGGGEIVTYLVGTVYLIVPDYDEAARALLAERAALDDGRISMCWNYDFDVNAPDQVALAEYLDANEQGIARVFSNERGLSYSGCSITLEGRERNRQDYLGLYGGLLFLGGVLSMVFLAAAVLIIYYKQLCEGYEDQSRFAIMRKVGMTDRDIRRSVNSQMLTVFFLPLLAAGLHMAFAFPMLTQLLRLLSMTDTTLFLRVTAASFGVFSLIYLAVYRLTSNAYYKIVTTQPENV